MHHGYDMHLEDTCRSDLCMIDCEGMVMMHARNRKIPHQHVRIIAWSGDSTA